MSILNITRVIADQELLANDSPQFSYGFEPVIISMVMVMMMIVMIMIITMMIVMMMMIMTCGESSEGMEGMERNIS